MVRKLTQASEEHTALMCGSQDADQGLINSEVCLILADQLTPYLCSAKIFKFIGVTNNTDEKQNSKPNLLFLVHLKCISISLLLFNLFLLQGAPVSSYLCSNPTYSSR